MITKVPLKLRTSFLIDQDTALKSATVEKSGFSTYWAFSSKSGKTDFFYGKKRMEVIGKHEKTQVSIPPRT